jgi:hypothetical protein
MTPRRRVSSRPEISDGFSTIQLRSAGKIFNAIDMEQDAKRDPSLPLIGPVFIDAHP